MTEKNRGNGGKPIDFLERMKLKKSSGHSDEADQHAELNAGLQEIKKSAEGYLERFFRQVPQLEAQLRMIRIITDRPYLFSFDTRWENAKKIKGYSLKDLAVIIFNTTEDDCEKEPAFYAVVFESYRGKLMNGEAVDPEWFNKSDGGKGGRKVVPLFKK